MLTSIQINLPSSIPQDWRDDLSFILSNISSVREKSLVFNTHFESFDLSIYYTNDKNVNVEFLETENLISSIDLTNSTGSEWASPHTYQSISIKEVRDRLMDNSIEIVSFDHAGFNLPYNLSGIHPEIKSLKSKIKDKSLLHEFPDEPNWLFILPGDSDEVSNLKRLDYTIKRKPKFEIVNFRKSSTPLIQIDLGTNTKYEKLKDTFPEAIHSDDLKNLWIYISNVTDIDICLVLGKASGCDWSEFFEGRRV